MIPAVIPPAIAIAKVAFAATGGAVAGGVSGFYIAGKAIAVAEKTGSAFKSLMVHQSTKIQHALDKRRAKQFEKAKMKANLAALKKAVKQEVVQNTNPVIQEEVTGIAVCSTSGTDEPKKWGWFKNLTTRKTRVVKITHQQPQVVAG
jgi:hypothetical protein